jgi:hypothetical protein
MIFQLLFEPYQQYRRLIRNRLDFFGLFSDIVDSNNNWKITKFATYTHMIEVKETSKNMVV